MTVDKSLKLGSTLQRPRSVLSRAERIEKLKEAGKWKDGDSVLGLPKVRVRRIVRKKAPKAEAAAGAEAAAPGAAPVAGAAAPAAGAKPAAEKAAPKEKAGKK